MSAPRCSLVLRAPRYRSLSRRRGGRCARANLTPATAPLRLYVTLTPAPFLTLGRTAARPPRSIQTWKIKMLLSSLKRKSATPLLWTRPTLNMIPIAPISCGRTTTMTTTTGPLILTASKRYSRLTLQPTPNAANSAPRSNPPSLTETL
eukprot:6184028-Pleurochrysis_carterae.AAC.2